MKFVVMIIAGVLAGMASFFTDRHRKNVLAKAMAVGVIAFIGSLATVAYERYDEAVSKPSIEVKRHMVAKYLSITVIPDEKPTLKNIKLSFHLPDRVKEVINDNRVTDGRAEVVVTGGTEVSYLTNRVDIDIYEVHPGRSVNFGVVFEPAYEVLIHYPGKGLYEISYTWSYGSKEFYESEWRKIDTNEKVNMPSVEVGVIRFFGNSENYSIPFSMKFIGAMNNGEIAEIVSVVSVKPGFAKGVKGIDDVVLPPIPRGTF